MGSTQLLKTADEAGVAAISAYNALSINADLEYGGSVCEIRSKYSWSIPNIGFPDSVTESSCPEGTKQVALYHTHGRAHFDGDGERFSTVDRRTANGLWRDPETGSIFVRQAMPVYLGTPSGTIKRFDPNTRKAPFDGPGNVVIFKQRTRTQ